MSRTALSLAATLLLVAPATGQGRAALEARVRDLQARVDAVNARIRVRDSLLDAGSGWRRVPRGLLVLEVHGQRDTAEAAVDTALTRLEATYGEALGHAQQIVLRATPRTSRAGRGRPAGIPQGLSVQFTGDVMPGQPASAPFVPAGAPVGDLAAAVAAVASEALWYQVDRPLARWHPAAPIAVPESLQARRTFVELATSDFASAAGCLAGGLQDCRQALGLVDDPADLVGSYSPRDRQAFVRRLAQDAVGERAGLAGQCLQLGQQEACDTLLRGREWGPMVPLGESARQLLLAVALREGGVGAMGRLLGHPDQPLLARLAAAARLPEDALLGRWLQVTRQSRGEGRVDTPRVAFAAVGWSLFLFGLAVRTFRWR